jgi:predicted nucleic acid-binding protein
MNSYVTDTIGLTRYLADSVKLGNNARALFEEADTGNCIILIPAMVLMEIMYLSEKNRIATTLPDIIDLVKDSINYQIYPINTGVVLKAKEITDIPELHDRIIAGTAAMLCLKLITKDETIGESTFVETIW